MNVTVQVSCERHSPGATAWMHSGLVGGRQQRPSCDRKVGGVTYIVFHLFSSSWFYLRLCIRYRHPYPFYPFGLVPAHTHTYTRASAQHFYNTAINVTSSTQWDGNLSAVLIACSTTPTGSPAALFYVLAHTPYTSFVYTVRCSIVL